MAVYLKSLYCASKSNCIVRSACPCYLRPTPADGFHFCLEKNKKIAVNMEVEMKGRRNWLGQNRTILHDISKISVININEHYIAVNAIIK